MDTVPIMIAGVFVALAALIVTMIGSLRRDIDKRMDGMEKRFDDRFDGVDRRMDGMEKRFDDRFDRMEKRFDDRFDGIDARLRSVEQGLAEVRGRIAFVESYILGRNEPAPEETPAE